MTKNSLRVLALLLLSTLIGPFTFASSNDFSNLFYFADKGSNSRGGYQQWPGYGYPNPQRGPQQLLEQAKKNWTSEEMATVTSAFDSLLQMEGLDHIFAHIRQLGRIPMQRFNEYPFPAPSGVKTCKRIKTQQKTHIWVSQHTPLFIGVPDSYFDVYAEDMEASGGKLMTHVSLHELFHFIDMKFAHISFSQLFLSRTGWHQVGQNEWRNSFLDYEEFDRVHEEYCNDESASDQTGQALQDFVKASGFPSVYSMTNPQEFFAEIAAVYYLNPDAKSRLHPEFVNFFDKLDKHLKN